MITIKTLICENKIVYCLLLVFYLFPFPFSFIFQSFYFGDVLI